MQAKQKQQFQPSTKSEFKFPNIERILQKELENSDDKNKMAMNSRYARLERTPTLEMKAGTVVYPGEQQKEGLTFDSKQHSLKDFPG